MIPLSPESLQMLLREDPAAAWQEVFNHLWLRLSLPIQGDIGSAIVHRDMEIGGLDLVLSSSAWDLWPHFERCAPATAAELWKFWDTAVGCRAILILDGLSLRESPWIVEEAARRNFKIHRSLATAAPLPSDTTSFARLLGLQQRSALASGAVAPLKFPGARGALFNQPWRECADTLPSHTDLFVWHEWPDSLLHNMSGPGRGLPQAAEALHTQLTGDDFWLFIERLATGRRLVITADHGYAASGQFSDVDDPSQKQYLQEVFGGERFVVNQGGPAANWLPPLDITFATARDSYRFALGRRAWSVRSGRKILSHGGITLLEVGVPFIELSRAS